MEEEVFLHFSEVFQTNYPLNSMKIKFEIYHRFVLAYLQLSSLFLELNVFLISDRNIFKEKFFLSSIDIPFLT